MVSYSFKKEAKLYIVYQGIRYNIDISNIDINQTFTENSFSKKTIQSKQFFEGSVINKANPANFNFSMPLIRESDFYVVFSLLLNYNTFDLYVETVQDIFKVEYSVITNGAFIIERNKELRLDISGQASKLLRVSSMPGTLDTRSNTMSYNLIKTLIVEIGGNDISENIVSVSIELQNNIQWVSNKLIQGACTVEEIIYPNKFVVDSRILSGNVTKNLTLDNTDLQTVNSNTIITIQAGETKSSVFSGIKLNQAKCSFTNRLATNNIFTQNYDWRFIDNSAPLSSLFTYLVSGVVSGAILDHLGAAILDSSAQAILES